MTTATYGIPAPVIPHVLAACADGVVEYTRVSRDRTGAGLAKTRQHDEIGTASTAAGAPVSATYSDNDISAYSGKPRPGYLQLLADIAAGSVRVLWVWHTDRLHRSNRELEEFITIIETAERVHGIRVEIRSVIGSVLDLNTATGRAHARFLGTVATLESDLKSERIRAKMRQKRDKGEPMGGRRRWGYVADMSRLDETEAAIIRGIARDIIAGRRLHNIAKELTANGTPPPSWKGVPWAMPEWTGSNVGAMIRRPHLAGYNVHRGQIVGRGNWTPVLDVETWEAVRAVLANPSRTGVSADTTPTGAARKWLLSGIARCGVCGGPLRVRKAVAGGRHDRAYGCLKFHVTRPMPLVDQVVIEETIGRLSDPGFAASFLPAEDDNRAALDARIEAIEQELERVEIERVLGKTTARAAKASKEAGMAELARLGGIVKGMTLRATLPAVFEGLAGNPNAAAVWDGLDNDRRRAVVDALMEVTILPAARRGARFDPNTVAIRWKTEDDA